MSVLLSAKLAQAVPFDTYGIAQAYISKKRIHSLQSIRWFREMEGFEDELEELQSECEEEEEEPSGRKRKSRYAELEEEIDDGEKRRIMSNGIEMP